MNIESEVSYIVHLFIVLIFSLKRRWLSSCGLNPVFFLMAYRVPENSSSVSMFFTRNVSPSIDKRDFLLDSRSVIMHPREQNFSRFCLTENVREHVGHEENFTLHILGLAQIVEQNILLEAPENLSPQHLQDFGESGPMNFLLPTPPSPPSEMFISIPVLSIFLPQYLISLLSIAHAPTFDRPDDNITINL